jgi:hypothetical protein
VFLPVISILSKLRIANIVRDETTSSKARVSSYVTTAWGHGYFLSMAYRTERNITKETLYNQKGSEDVQRA